MEYSERKNRYRLSHRVSMETEKEPLEGSQGEKGGYEKDGTQQNSSQDRTKLMGTRHVEQSISMPTYAPNEPCDPATWVLKTTPDTAGEAAPQET